MSRAENEAYWGATDTAPQALDNFFDEDCEVTWTGTSSNIQFTKQNSHSSSGNVSTTSSVGALGNSLSSTSIADNITHSTHDWNSEGTASGRLAKGFGKTIGEKLDSFKPPSVSIKWNASQGQGSASCLQCSAKDEEIAQLKRRLENSYSRYNLTLPPDDTVNRIVLGQPYSLESYRSHEDKCALIDVALNTMDGGAILATVLHMKNTVKKNLFIKEMQTRSHAAQVYVHYLKQRHSFAEAIDFLGLLGKNEEAAILTYHMAVTSKDTASKLANLKKALQTSFSDPGLSHEAKMVKDHIQLLERQILIDEADAHDQSNPMLLEYPRVSSITDKSLLTTLFYCSMYHWDAPESHPASPTALRKAHGIPERQVLWTVIRGRARVNHWPLPNDLDSWMGNKGLRGALGSLTSAFTGSSKLVKNVLPVEQVVHTLAASNAPSNVLAAYIALLDSLDTRLKLAVNHKCHQAAVEVFIAQKDREALEKYMKEIPAGSPEFLKAESALKTVRWKN
ncbi:spermatogenesis-defective protein 39 homolog [Penaeus monodon]|uniref:spermatogenesis-defective protein 39 homolog n=1 Tax=Penaeus monodon TaxID=6687 RepID=UPI0018A71DC7|nr:spermatogenesis-defective protein 39 homolog [Penaeus monodon]